MAREELDINLKSLMMLESIAGVEHLKDYLRKQIISSEDPTTTHFKEKAIEGCIKAKQIILAYQVPNAGFIRQLSIVMGDKVDKFLKMNYNGIPSIKGLLDSKMSIVMQQISMLSFVSLIKDINDINDSEKVFTTAFSNIDGICASMGYYVYLTALINTRFQDKFNELFISSWCDYFENLQARIIMFQMAGNSWKSQFEGIPF